MIINMIKNTCFTDEKRHRVFVQNVPVCTGTTRTHVATCVRVVPARTHGDIGGHTAPHHTTPRRHTKTPHTKERRQDKRREKIHFQCGGAWPFFVGEVISG